MNTKSKFLQQTEELPPNYPFGSEANIPILFHYTGFDTLLSMAQTKELWATNIHFLNDYEEFKNALSIAKTCIKLIQREKNKDASGFLEQMYSRIDTIESLNMHIVSFTANGDLLSQWRAYCPKGGVSVGFRYHDLHKLAQNQKFSIRKCIYNDKEKQNPIKEVIDLHLDFFEEGENADLLLNGFMSVLAIIAPCCKNQAFEEEQEWRLISEPISVLDPHIGIRAKTHLMFPYYRFSLEGLPEKNGKNNLSFDRFIIGPSANSTLSNIAFGYFLNKYKLKYDSVTYSKIPYRTL